MILLQKTMLYVSSNDDGQNVYTLFCKWNTYTKIMDSIHSAFTLNVFWNRLPIV